MRCAVGKMQCNATLNSRDDMLQGEREREYREVQTICMAASSSSSRWLVGGWVLHRLPVLPCGRHTRLLPLRAR